MEIDLLDARGNVRAQMRGLSLQPAPVSVQGAVERFLQQEAALQLQKPLDGMATDRSYFDLGFSAPAISSFIQSINELLAESLSPSLLFDYRDIRSLAAFLAATYPHKVAAMTALAYDGGGVSQRRQSRSLVPLPRTGWCSRPAAREPERSREQLLEEILWQEASLDGSYEKVTF